jgi:hypothetical protein
MILVTVAILLAEAQTNEISAAEKASGTWIACIHRQAKRLFLEQASAESVADAALYLCDKERNDYWSAMYDMYRKRPTASDPRLATEDYMKRSQSDNRAALIALILDMRAVAHGRP